MKLKIFFGQFPNPWALRVSGMGGYTSKCEKMSKSLHPSGHANSWAHIASSLVILLTHNMAMLYYLFTEVLPFRTEAGRPCSWMVRRPPSLRASNINELNLLRQVLKNHSMTPLHCNCGIWSYELYTLLEHALMTNVISREALPIFRLVCFNL